MKPATETLPPGRLERFALLIGHVVPDAITASVILLLLLAGAALALGNPGGQVMDAYYRGLWMLLPFTMQMTLIIVLSSALSSAPAVRAGILWLAGLPKTRGQVIALGVLVVAAAAYCYWGLAYVIVPVVAVFFSRAAERKSLDIDFPFLLAVLWAASSVWQYGLSASAPLLIATPGHFLEGLIGVIPLARTIWSPAALVHEAVFLAVTIAAGCLLMPKQGAPLSRFPESQKLLEAPPESESQGLSYSERLERNSLLSLLLAAVLAGWLYFHFRTSARSLDINALNTTLLLLNLLLHRNFKRFAGAVERAVVSGWAVIVLYHLYAGVAGVVQYTSVGERMAGFTASIASPLTYPLLTAAVGTVFSIFIPSSGGQWVVQGMVTSKAALAVGVTVERGLLALSVGDQMGNLTTPFWYVLIAGIARIDFRRFFGYGLLFAALWFVIGVAAFTWLPC